MGYIRFYLAFLVYASHVEWFGPMFKISANYAVFSFFVISGFVVGYVAKNKYSSVGLFYFYARRWKSLIGYYLLATLFSFAMICIYFLFYGVVISPFDKIYIAISEWNVLQIVLYFFSLLSFFGLNVVGWQLLPVQPSWTLGVELFSWILIYYLKFCRLPFLVAIFFVCLLISIFLPSDKYMWYGMEYFVLGLIALNFRSSFIESFSLSWLNGNYGFFFVIFLYMFSFDYICAMPYFIGIVLVFVDLKNEPSFVDDFFGNISYPFYLFHVPCFKVASFLTSRVPGGGQSLIWVFLSFLIPFLISAVIIYLFPRSTSRLYKKHIFKDGLQKSAQ